jgi:oleandomycin transport system ATP-binding protein
MNYSGGMRRRLDLAASMIGRPAVLYLDEPTTGLDPRTRNEVWEEVQRMVAEGATVLLTTQYMEEAEQLANELTVIDRGKVIAGGAIDDLKAKVGGRTLRIRPADPLELRPLAAALDDMGLTGLATSTVDAEAGAVLVPILSDEQLTAVVGAVTARGITIGSIATELPSLDEVFLSITGQKASAPQDDTRTSELEGAAV